MKYYVFSGRFQPLDKLREKLLIELANKIGPNDKIIIGIVNYDPSNPMKNDDTTGLEAFYQHFNPLSYWERYSQIVDFLTEEGILNKVVSITPLPRPSTNMAGANNYLPKKNSRMICLPIVHDDSEEENKENGLQRQGENIYKINAMDYPVNLRICSPELILSLIVCHNERWREFVSEKVATSLSELNIVERLANNNYVSTNAIKRIGKLYNRAFIIEEKDALKELYDSVTNVQNNNNQISEEESKLKLNISLLQEQMENAQKKIIGKAPKLEKKINQYLNDLNSLSNELNNNLTQDTINEIKQKVYGISKLWEEDQI